MDHEFNFTKLYYTYVKKMNAAIVSNCTSTLHL